MTWANEVLRSMKRVERTFSSLRVRTLVALALAACAAPSARADDGLDGGVLDAAEPDPAFEAAIDEACGAGADTALRVNDFVLPTCPAVFGDDEVRARNREARLLRLLHVVSAGRRVDILHQDPALREPKLRRLEGIHILSILPAEVEEISCADAADAGLVAVDAAEEASTRERVALVAVDPAFRDLCPAELYAVRVDDALGVDGQIVAVEPSGLLTLYRNRLVWVPRGEGAERPSFRMIWRSDFAVIVEDKSNKPKKKRRPRRRRRRR